jgi:hypothetical protein
VLKKDAVLDREDTSSQLSCALTKSGRLETLLEGLEKKAYFVTHTRSKF